MTDDQIREELDRLAHRVEGGAPDLANLLNIGHRRLRARRAAVALTGVVGTAVVALGATALAGGATKPDPVVGMTGTTSTSAAETATTTPTETSATETPGAGTGDVAITDRGGQIQGYGFGVPVDSMAPATDGAGNVTLQPITKEQATESCWPVLEQVVPGSTIDDWTLNSRDDFPSHATRYVQWQTSGGVIATCVLPGGPTEVAGPTNPPGTEPFVGQERCGALADVDLTGFAVVAEAAAGDATAISFRSANDHLVRCVLSDDPAVRTLQISQDPIGTDNPLDDGLLYGTYWTTTFTSTGYVGTDAARVVITIDGEDTAVDVADGFYAVVIPLDAPLSTEDDFHGRIEDAAGAVLFEGSWDDFGMLPAECLTAIEEDHGC